MPRVLQVLVFGTAVIDVLHGQVYLILVALRVTAVVRALVGEHTPARNLVLVKEWHPPIVE
jgi:hypothetical protein